MAEKVLFDPITKIIEVTLAPVSGTVDIDFQIDVFSDGKEDWITDLTLNKLQFPIRSVGGDTISDTTDLGATFFLLYGWQIRPYSANHKLLINGNIFTDPSGGNVFLAASGSFSVTIETTVSNLTSVEIVGGSTASVNISSASLVDMADAVWDEQLSGHSTIGSAGETLANVGAGASPALIADAVWNETTSSHTTPGTFGGTIVSSSFDTKYILGLVQHNFRMTNQVYDANGNMTSAEVNIYPSSADATAETNSINTYNVTAVYDGDDKLIDYKMVE